MAELIAQSLVNRISQGDEQAYKTAFEMHYRHLVICAYQILKDENIAKDAVQEVFLELWKNKKRLTDEIILLPYLKRSVMNRALNVLKSRKHHMSAGEGPLISLTDKNIQPDTQAETSELRDVVFRAIDTMPDRCRAVFMACRMEGLSHAEIAEKLSISTKTIQNQMTKALKIMRNAIEVYHKPMLIAWFFSLTAWGIDMFHLLMGYDL